MFERLREVLRQSAAKPAESREDARHMAAAVLLLEVARADYSHSAAERETLRAGLASEFGVPEDALDALLGKAERRAKQSVSLYDFVKTLNQSLSQDDKRALLRLLWDVAHADGTVDPHEEHLIRQLAELLHLSHADFIRGKLAAEEKAGKSRQ